MDSGDTVRLEKRMRLAGKAAVVKALADAEVAGPDSPAGQIAAKYVRGGVRRRRRKRRKKRRRRRRRRRRRKKKK